MVVRLLGSSELLEEEVCVEVTYPNRIGVRVQTARRRRGWTREALAYHSGLSWAAIAQIETGRRTNLRPVTLAALAGALGVTVDYLVAGCGAPAMMEHYALIYETTDELARECASALTGALDRAEATLVITSRATQRRVRRELGADAARVRFLENRRQLQTPAAIIPRLRAFVEEAVARGAPWVRIIAEPLEHGRSRAQTAAMARCESLINVAFRSSPVTIVCPYDARALGGQIIGLACATHPHIQQGQTLSPCPHYVEPSEFLLDAA